MHYLGSVLVAGAVALKATCPPCRFAYGTSAASRELEMHDHGRE
jgi:hypothetical protein